MIEAKLSCAYCGAPVVLKSIFPVFVDGGFAICSACQDRHTEEEGGVVVDVKPAADALLPLGRVTVTPGAVQLLSENDRHFWELTARHAAGDWGEQGTFAGTELTPDEVSQGFAGVAKWTDDDEDDDDEDERDDEDAVTNKIATLKKRGLVHSVYPLKPDDRESTIWVMTHMYEGSGVNTTVLTPDEY